MRLLSANQTTSYVLKDERDKETGKPFKGATVWYFRPLTSREEGILQDSLIDLSNMSVKNADKGDAADVDMKLRVSPSMQRERKIRLSLTGWENLQDSEGNDIPYEAEEFDVNGNTMKGAPGTLLESLPGKYLMEFDTFVRSLTNVEVAEGNG